MKEEITAEGPAWAGPTEVLPFVGGAALLAFPLFYWQDAVSAWSGLLFLALLFCAALEDGRTGYISDSWSLALAAGGFAHWLWKGALTDLLGAAGICLLFGAVYLAGRVLTGEEILGEGDIFFSGAAALWLSGWEMLLFLWIAFVLGGIAAAAVLAMGRKKRNEGLPFVPFLALGGGAAYVLGGDILRWYLSLLC